MPFVTPGVGEAVARFDGSAAEQNMKHSQRVGDVDQINTNFKFQSGTRIHIHKNEDTALPVVMLQSPRQPGALGNGARPQVDKIRGSALRDDRNDFGDSDGWGWGGT
jgi:hypothetical protein